MKIDLDVFDLVLKCNSKSCYQGEKHFFKGDICQMVVARKIANSLGIYVDIDGGLPFVTSEEDFKDVTKEIVDNQLEGWWHYVTHEEYCQIKGEFYFNGEYLRRSKEIKAVAEKLNISLRNTRDNVLYVTTKEEHSLIISKLD